MSITQQIQDTKAALADEIKTRHEACQGIQDDAIERISDTIKARVEIARLVETAYATINSGYRFLTWWNDQGLPVGWAEKYLRIAKTADRNALGDNNQLRLMGLLPEAEHGETGHTREPNLFGWTKWAGKIRTTLTTDAISQMGQMDREIAIKQLEPLVQVYRDLGGVMAMGVAG